MSVFLSPKLSLKYKIRGTSALPSFFFIAFYCTIFALHLDGQLSEDKYCVFCISVSFSALGSFWAYDADKIVVL